MQSTTPRVGVRSVRANRAAERGFPLLPLFVSLAIHVCIAFGLSSAVELEVETRTRPAPNDRCEEITIPMCKALHLYNHTMYPNILGHRTQDDAGLEIHQYYPLVKVQCSQHLAPFLCIMFAPPCTPVTDLPVPPCRSLCDAARNGCIQLMNKFGFQWPENLDCSNFPESGLCVGEKDLTQETPPPPSPPPPSPSPPVYEEATPTKTVLPSIPPQHGRCQPVTVPLCQSLQYTETITPNLLGQETQEQAERAIARFEPFIKVNCSPYLRFFLCATLVPPCSSALLTPLPPCRSLCIESQRGCTRLFALFGLKWPDVLECSQFPIYGLCVGKEAFLELQIQEANENKDRIVKCETKIVNILAKREKNENF